MLKNKILIVTGGTIDDAMLKEFVSLGEYRYIYGVDKGLEKLITHDIEADLAIGDFDSALPFVKEKYLMDTKTILLNPEKDYTDTHVAVMEAIKSGAKEITLIGATGSRLDHVLGNIALLKLCLLRGVKAEIIDTNNRITMIDKEIILSKSSGYGKYVSLIPYSDKVTGINSRGFKYELTGATLVKEETIGISNELREEEGHISIEDGFLLILETKD